RIAHWSNLAPRVVAVGARFDNRSYDRGICVRAPTVQAREQMHPHSPNIHESRPRWSRGRSTRIGVIGAGELGLSMAIVLAERGHQVVLAGCDVEQAGSRQLA